MFDAQLLIAKSAAYEIYSPWMSRGGDYLRATLDLVDVDGATLTVKVFTKNAEDTGNGSEAGTTTITLSTAGQESAEWGPGVLKELVRYEFTISGTAAGKWALFRMLSPVWFDAVRGS